MADEKEVMQEIKIRQLKRKDRKTLTALLKKLVDQFGQGQLAEMISSSSGDKKDDSENVAANAAENKKRMMDIGLQIFGKLIQFLEEDVSAWFADLAGESIEEYDDLPFDAEAQIVGQILEASEFQGFFTQASLIYKKMTQLAGPLMETKEKPVSEQV